MAMLLQALTSHRNMLGLGVHGASRAPHHPCLAVRLLLGAKH